MPVLKFLSVSMVTLVLAVVYWFSGTLASWNGPEDDIGTVYWIVPLLVLFTMSLVKHDPKAVVGGLLAYAVFITCLLLARHAEILHRSGYDQWHAHRSIEALLWFYGWFLACVIVGIKVSDSKKRKTKCQEDEEAQPGTTAQWLTSDVRQSEMTPALPHVFRSVVSSISGQSPEETTDWRVEEKEGVCSLVIPKLAADGFDLTVEADDSEVTVYSEFIAHQHFTSDGNHEEVCRIAMGLVRDLLSPAMRLRVIEVGGKPSRAHFETSRAGVWHRESTTALFSLLFFRKRVERFYINRRLPIRGEPNQPPQRNAGSRPSSDDSPASETPSSLGPRG